MAPPQKNRPANRSEVLLGRSLAACAHPLAAWRSRASPFRAMVVATYFAIGYVTILAALLILP